MVEIGLVSGVPLTVIKAHILDAPYVKGGDMYEKPQTLNGHKKTESLIISSEEFPGQYHTLMELMDFFSEQPTFQEFSQFLVTNTFSSFDPWGACIAVASHHDHMQLIGSFGLGEGLMRQYISSSCIGMPLENDIMVNGKPIKEGSLQAEHDPNHAEKCGLCKALNSQGPNAVGLISSHRTFMGFFQILFMHPVHSPELIAKMEATLRFMRVVMPIQVHNHAQGSDLLAHLDGAGQLHAAVQDSHLPTDEIELSARQTEILHHMAQGKTNSAIAHLIGFSESTVRQETIDIYRRLGVNDRRTAVTRAQSLGLMPLPVAALH